MFNIRRTVSTAVLAAFLFIFSPAFAGNGQNLLPYIPADAGIVFNLNVEQVRTSSLYQTIWGLLSADPDVQQALTEMQTAAGFDPSTDISSILVAVNPENEDHYAVLIEGSYNVDQIRTFLSTVDASEMATMEYAGQTVYHNPSETGDDKAYVSLISDSLVAIGTQAELSAVLDTMAGTTANVTTNADVSGLISATDMTGAFWFVGAVTPSMQEQMAGTPMASMTSMRGGGTLTGGITANYVIGTATDADAAGMAEFLNAGLGEARTSPEVAAMGLTAILDSVSIAASGTDVAVNVAIPEETVNQIVGFISAMAAAGGFQ